MDNDDEHLPIVRSERVFNIDYFSLTQVKVLAKKLGHGMCVVQYQDCKNYDIVHISKKPFPKGTRIFYTE